MNASETRNRVYEALKTRFQSMRESGQTPCLDSPQNLLAQELGLSPAEVTVHLQCLGREGRISFLRQHSFIRVADKSVALQSMNAVIVGSGARATAKPGNRAVVRDTAKVDSENAEEEIDSAEVRARIGSLEDRIRELERANSTLGDRLTLAENKRNRLKEELRVAQDTQRDAKSRLITAHKQLSVQEAELVALRQSLKALEEGPHYLSSELSSEVRARMSPASAVYLEKEGGVGE